MIMIPFLMSARAIWDKSLPSALICLNKMPIIVYSGIVSIREPSTPVKSLARVSRQFSGSVSRFWIISFMDGSFRWARLSTTLKETPAILAQEVKQET